MCEGIYLSYLCVRARMRSMLLNRIVSTEEDRV